MPRDHGFSPNFLQDYSDDGLLQEVRRVADLLPADTPLTIQNFDRHSRASASCIRRRLRLPWAEILRRAGLVSRCHPRAEHALVTRADCEERLRLAAKRLGQQTISMRDYRTLVQSPTPDTICKLFGTWNAALRAAGLQSKPRTHRSYSREECLTNLHSIYRATQSQPTYRSLSEYPSHIGPKAYERHWETFSAALRDFEAWMGSCGHDFTLAPASRTRGASPEELAAELRRVATAVGSDTISQTDVLNHSSISPRTFTRRLGNGSWQAALECAGLVLSSQAHRRYEDEEYFENLMKVWEALGRQPRCREMKRDPSVLSGEAYCNRFGGWRKAITKFLDWLESEPSPGVPRAELVRAPRAKSAPSTALETQDDPSVNQRTPTPKLSFLVRRRDEFRCVYCGATAASGADLEVDHIRPYSKGGRTALSNLQTLCSRCNRGKGALSLEPAG